MSSPSILIVGATGQVGSQIATILAQKGHHVRALIRDPNRTIHNAPANITYTQGDLNDPDSLKRATEGIDVVLSTANAVIPRGNRDQIKSLSTQGYNSFIQICEEQGVRQFIQSSVPVHPMEHQVPELHGKRLIEARLNDSSLSTTVVRNPAFTDVWLVMTGAIQAIGSSPHASAKRPFGFMKTYLGLVGNLVVKRGLMLAPGGPEHGAMFITTRDVAHMMAACVDHPKAQNTTIEAGGPQWVTWRDIALLYEQRLGKPIRILPMQPWLANLGRLSTRPFSKAASNILALTQFVATYQPRWDASKIVKDFNLPPQTTVAQYMDENLAV